MKLALGTVQFGLAYGAFNRVGGRTSVDAVAAMLGHAASAGIDTLDTARAYGDAEAVLGALNAADRFRIVTKVPELGDAPAGRLTALFDESCAALGTDRVSALMLHRASDLTGSHAAERWAELEALQSAGRVDRVGVSIYTPDEALALLDRFPITIIQAPYNVFDRRILLSGLLDKCAAQGVEVHVRSILLQGFLLADPNSLPASLALYRNELDAFIERAGHSVDQRLAAALSVAVAEPRIDRIVVGAETLKQLDGLIVASQAMSTDNATMDDLIRNDVRLLNPALWNA